ncbi:hypothetical protein GOP47_0024903 [Adiantum capillus-veneris]|uniref:Uncharacterized protein n=1 Tax=Adiantum capillus-veneris TaxID=13818 RepID=A0A9D4U3V0_ADICA|nr:hypothetical protein GOP47_0024903 [Adiantum capillus-veneris]
MPQTTASSLLQPARLRPFQQFPGESSSPLPLLKLPGRETSAGRALFALFNGYDLARKRGNLYSEHNAVRIRSRPPTWHPPELKTPPKPPPQKKTVRLPRFRRRPIVDPSHCQRQQAVGRRKASEILKQLQIDLECKELPPYPTKPLLDDKEKARLAMLFEWSGRLDKDQLMAEMTVLTRQPPKLKCRVRMQKIPQGSVEEMEKMVEQIAKEIQEREEFIREMDKLGQAQKYKSQVHSEIQKRVKEMEKLDMLITAEGR